MRAFEPFRTFVLSTLFFGRQLQAMKSVKTLTGKVALVTGSTDGIGQHTATLLAQAGAKVLIHGRSQDRIDASKSKILAAAPDADIESYCYDLFTLDATKAFADDVLSKNQRLDMLINNAGVFQHNRIISKDGLESTFAINVAATFILFCKLFPLMRITPGSRILNVSSMSQTDLGKIDLSNLQFEKGGFNEYNSYSLSKLCVAALSHELAMRVSPEQALVMSCDPGTVNTKMLLAGWGRCGIDVSTADHEFNLMTVPLEFPTSQSDRATAAAAAATTTTDGRSISRQLERLMQLGTAEAAHGQYFDSGSIRKCCADVYNDTVRQGLWTACEEITGVTLPNWKLLECSNSFLSVAVQ